MAQRATVYQVACVNKASFFILIFSLGFDIKEIKELIAVFSRRYQRLLQLLL